jgi:5-methyltetrahydrofolate--homocysteine methyltransferase
LAREVADEFTAKNPDKPRFVAGSIGPTNRTANVTRCKRSGYRAVTLMTHCVQATSRSAYGWRLRFTFGRNYFDTLNAKAAFAIEEVKERNRDIPIMVSGTITDASGRTLSDKR